MTNAQIGSLPAGNGNYIQNTTTQQAANFNISGNGLIGGNVGLGTLAPTGRLTIQSAGSGSISFQAPTTDIEYDGGSDGLFVFKDNGGKTAFFGGNIGIGTATPTDKLQINGDLRLGLQEGTTTPGVYGSRLYFSGGSKFGTFDADNSDPFWLARFNVANDVSELRLSVGGTDTFTAGEKKRILFGDSEFVSIGEEDADDEMLLTSRIRFRFAGGPVEPTSNGAQNLGSLANRWANVFAANGAIQTSDGVLSGTVVVSCTFNFTVRATDAGGIGSVQFHGQDQRPCGLCGDTGLRTDHPSNRRDGRVAVLSLAFTGAVAGNAA